MKTTPFVPFLCLVGGLAAAEPAAKPADWSFSWASESDSTAAVYRAAGERAIATVGGQLVTEIDRLLAAHDPAEIIGAVHLKDFKVPPPAPGQPAILAIKRTSLLVRNPANAPDPADRAALDFIRGELQDGNQPPKILVQHVAVAGQPAEIRVYRPIGILSKCTVCHGPADELSPEVVAALKKAYPDDKAVNYFAGDWRGVIRISFAAPAASK